MTEQKTEAKAREISEVLHVALLMPMDTTGRKVKLRKIHKTTPSDAQLQVTTIAIPIGLAHQRFGPIVLTLHKATTEPYR